MTGREIQKRSDNTSLTSLVYGKIPPQAKDLEEVVLGAIMLEKGAMDIVLEHIPDERYFYVDAHQRIFKSMRSLHSKSTHIDSLTVMDELAKQGDLEAVGGGFKLVTLTNNVASAAHIVSHSKIIVEKFGKRELIRIAGQMIKDGYDDQKDFFESCESSEKMIFELSNRTVKSDFEHISAIAYRGLKKIDELRNREYALTGVPTGFNKLDRITNGWQPTDLIIIAARPSVGKTAFAINLALNSAFSEEKQTNVGIFSLEMSKEQIFQRMAAATAKIPLEWIRNGSLSDGKAKQLQVSVEKMCEKKIYIDDTAGLNVFELRSKCRRMKLKHNVGLIILDYLQLMAGENRGNREQEISYISRQLKNLAKNLEVPVIALSQLSRDVEKRDGIPRLSDLRESGAIEQDADIVTFLWRPSDKDVRESGIEKNSGYLKFGKHRNGSLDDVELYSDMTIQKWFNYEEGMDYSKTVNEKLIPMKVANQFYQDPTEPKSLFDEEAPF